MKKVLIGIVTLGLFAFAGVSANAYTIPSGYTKDCPFMGGTISVRKTATCPDPLKQCTLGTYTFWIQTTRNCPVL